MGLAVSRTLLDATDEASRDLLIDKLHRPRREGPCGYYMHQRRLVVRLNQVGDDTEVVTGPGAVYGLVEQSITADERPGAVQH